MGSRGIVDGVVQKVKDFGGVGSKGATGSGSKGQKGEIGSGQKKDKNLAIVGVLMVVLVSSQLKSDSFERKNYS